MAAMSDTVRPAAIKPYSTALDIAVRRMTAALAGYRKMELVTVTPPKITKCF
jgi:hypothetical protein